MSAAQALGLTRQSTVAALDEAFISAVIAARRTLPGRHRGAAWVQCEAQREFIAQRLAQGLRLSKLRKLLLRQGVAVPYATLQRFAVAELGFGLTMSNERQPGRASGIGSVWPIVSLQHAANDIFVDFYVEGISALLGYPHAAEFGIAALQPNDHRYQFLGWPLRTWLTSMACGRKEQAIISINQGLVKRE